MVWQGHRVTQQKNIPMKIVLQKNAGRNSPLENCHQEWIFFHPPGLSESQEHLCLHWSWKKCSPIYLFWGENKRKGWVWDDILILNSQKKLWAFKSSTFRVLKEKSLRWSWIVQPSSSTLTCGQHGYHGRRCLRRESLVFRKWYWHIELWPTDQFFGRGVPRYFFADGKIGL